MPESSLWSLVIALIVLALGGTLKAVEYRRSFDKADKEASDLRSEMATLKNENEQAIARMAKLHQDNTAHLVKAVQEFNAQKLQHGDPISSLIPVSKAGDVNITGGAGSQHGDGGAVNITGGSFKAGDA